MYAWFFFKMSMINMACMAAVVFLYRLAIHVNGDPVTVVGIVALLMAVVQTFVVWADDHENRSLSTE